MILLAELITDVEKEACMQANEDPKKSSSYSGNDHLGEIYSA